MPDRFIPTLSSLPHMTVLDLTLSSLSHKERDNKNPFPWDSLVLDLTPPPSPQGKGLSAYPSLRGRAGLGKILPGTRLPE